MEKIFFGIIVFICGAFVWAIIEAQADAREAKRAFMEECQRDKKHYECQAMWRSGDSQVMPIYIPMNR